MCLWLQGGAPFSVPRLRGQQAERGPLLPSNQADGRAQEGELTASKLTHSNLSKSSRGVSQPLRQPTQQGLVMLYTVHWQLDLDQGLCGTLEPPPASSETILRIWLCRDWWPLSPHIHVT